jgi:hypothetical protein
MTIDELKQHLASVFDRTNSNNAFMFYLKSHENVKDELQKMLDAEPWFENLYRCGYCVYKGITSKVCCPTCGKEIDARKASNGHKFCSSKCSNNSSETKQKKLATTRERYGTDYAIQSDAGKEKQRQTNLERYGDACPLKNANVRKKAVETSLKKYGTEYPMQSKEYRDSIGYKSSFGNSETREKIKKTMVERYSSECSLQNEEVREKVRQTNLAKYGSEYGFGSKEIQDKIRKTNLERYGVENTFQRQDVKDRIRQRNIDEYGVTANALRPEVKQKKHDTMVRKYGVDNPSLNPELHDKAVRSCLCNAYDRIMEKWKNHVIPLFSKDEYIGCVNGQSYKWKCVKCGKEFEQVVHTTGNNVFRFMPRCWHCYPNMNEQGQSYKEKEVLDFVKSIYNGEIIPNAHGIIGRKELDIYLPEKHLAIEFDGFYWHSEQKGKGESYHLDKTNACADKGIRLIHIFEDEWNLKQDIVKDRIRSILGIGQTRIFARKCIVRDIDSKTSNMFLEANHLQGGDNSSIRYGLYFNDELVAVMTFGKPRFNKNHDWELIRFASKCGVNVVGGASKLLNHFRSSHSGSIVSYADRRYSDGNLYEQLGFVQVGVSNPNYWYVKGVEKLTRYACQKHKLKDVLGDGFDPNLSEFENMSLNGWTRVHDCGNIVFVKS